MCHPEAPMKTSNDRILTTHVGSLPRSQEVVDLLFAQDRGEPIDEAHFDQIMGSAVDDLVRRRFGHLGQGVLIPLPDDRAADPHVAEAVAALRDVP